MSKFAKLPKPSKRVLIWFVGVLAVLWATTIWPLRSWRQHLAVSYVDKAIYLKANEPNEALTLLKFATMLDGGNAIAWQEAAKVYESAGNADGAIEALQHLHTRAANEQSLSLMLRSGQYARIVAEAGKYARTDNSPRYQLWASQAQLELNQPAQAIQTAEQAAQNSVGDTDIQLQLGLAYLVSDKTKETDSLISSMKPGEALETLKAARAVKYTLASALYSQGLLMSSERVLAGESKPDLQESTLLAMIRLALYPSDKQKLAQTKVELERATGEYPADIRLHELLKTVYEKLGDGDKAKAQQDLIDRLTNGRV